MIAGACTTLAVILLGLVGAPDDLPSPDGNRVALAAPQGSRLGQQLRRELQASGFEVEAVATATAATVAGVSASRAVVVDARGDRVRLLARAGAELIATDQLSVARHDDLALRRVALAVVEHLRRPRAPSGPATPVAASVTPQATAEAAAALAPEPPPSPEVRRRPWSLGAATSLDLDGGVGESTGHLQLVGETALTGRLLGSVRLHWPMLGAQLHLPDRRVRLWTLAAAGGLRVRLPGWGKLQPLLGTTAGLRFVLTDTDRFDPRQSNVALAPALTAGAFAGARYAVAPLVHVALEVASEWSRPLGDPASEYNRDAASARATRVALGVVFEY